MRKLLIAGAAVAALGLSGMTVASQTPRNETFRMLQLFGDTLAVIGRPATTASVKEGAPQEGAAGEGAAKPKADRDKPLREGEMAGMTHWPVTLSYFTAGEGERTPIYVLTFDLYENGVSGNLRLDYGEFAVAGNLSRLDKLPAATDCKS